MADLDEALFPLEGVVGFSATLSRGARDRLDITVELVSGTPEQGHRVVAALSALPAIDRAVALGALELGVAQRTYDPARGIVLRKRAIIE
jgi:hypothetical protein